MNISQSVSEQIGDMRPGQFLTYQDITGFADKSYAVIKALSRQASILGLVRIKKGLYYKAVNGSFGPMAPKDTDVIKYFTYINNKVTGYITGPSLFHRWGLTTQVPAELTIATSTNKREKAVIAGLRVATIPAKDIVNKNTIPLLQFLDVIKDIDRIADADGQVVIAKLTARLKQYTSSQIDKMEDIAIRAYGAKTRALLGLLLQSDGGRYSAKLYQSLNPTSRYKTAIAQQLPINAKHWYLYPKSLYIRGSASN